MSENYFVRKAEAAKRFGVRVRTLERWEELGFFPPPRADWPRRCRLSSQRAGKIRGVSTTRGPPPIRHDV